MGEERNYFEEEQDIVAANLMYLLSVTELMKDRIKESITYVNVEAKNMEDINEVYKTIKVMRRKYSHVIDTMIEDCYGEKGKGAEDKES